LCTTIIGALAQPLKGRLKVTTFQTSPNKQFSLVTGRKKSLNCTRNKQTNSCKCWT